MFRHGILRTGKAMVGEEVPVRGRCLVQWLALDLEVIGWSSMGSCNRMVFLFPKVELGWRLLSNGAQANSGKTQRDKIIEAVEVLRLLLGQGVCSQVEDLIQEHIPPSLPLPKVTPLPFPY